MTVDEEQKHARDAASYMFLRCRLVHRGAVLPLISDSSYPLTGVVTLV
jgi:hypothetical protein